VRCSLSDISPFIDLCSEKYLKKLVGKKEIEEALKRLDKLTQEEARMAAAENLRLTQFVYDNGDQSEMVRLEMFTVPLILSERVCLDGKETKSRGPTTGEQRG
jgi:hypothetical protein